MLCALRLPDRQIVDGLYAAVRAFGKTKSPLDDMTAIVVKVNRPNTAARTKRGYFGPTIPRTPK